MDEHIKLLEKEIKKLRIDFERALLRPGATQEETDNLCHKLVLKEEIVEVLKKYNVCPDLIDAEPVRHGTWIGFTKKHNGEDVCYVRCPVCGSERPFDYELRYCNYCGAKMMEIKNNETV